MTAVPVSIPELEGKAILITGASTGIGAALAAAFAAQGSHVGIHYNSSGEAAEQLRDAIRASGGTAQLFRADATDTAASRAAIPALKVQGGFVINTTSIAGRNGASSGAGLYGSAKAFVQNVTRGMAKELIPFGVRVNAVSPGVISTPFHERYSTESQLEAMRATIPQGRLGVVADCVGAYLFLAAPSLSGYIIGQTIEVNGGQLMP